MSNKLKEHKSNVNYFLLANVLQTELNRAKSKLGFYKSSLENQIRDIEQEDKIEYTESYVLMRRDKDGNWQSACYCPYDDEDGENMPMEDFEVILPIPKPETLKEFEGF